MRKKKSSVNYNQGMLPLEIPSIFEWPKNYGNFLTDAKLTEHKFLGCDLETQGLSPYVKNAKILSIGYAVGDSKACAMLWDELENIDRETIVWTLQNPEIVLIGHNIKFDINWLVTKLKEEGIQVKVRCRLFDTMYAEYLLNENIPKALEDVIERYGFDDIKKYAPMKEMRSDFSRVSKQDILIYQCSDADASRRAMKLQLPKLKELGLEKLNACAMQALPILSSMETTGVYIDLPYANVTRDELFSNCVKTRIKLQDTVGCKFDPNKDEDVRRILYKEFNLDPIRWTKTGRDSTDHETLVNLYDQVATKLQEQFLDDLISYNKDLKLVTTYYQPLAKWIEYDGAIHCNFGLTGTKTGRLNCTNPNLQQFPRGIRYRGMVKARPGKILLDGDFSQNELRMIAWLADEEAMKEAFAKNYDIHTAVMADLLEYEYEQLLEDLKHSQELKDERVAIKNINFGIAYGAQAFRLQRLLRMVGVKWSLDECQSMLDRWLGRYTGVGNYIKVCQRFAAKRKFVGMPLGQIRRLPDASYEDAIGRKALRQSSNFQAQSMSVWICLIGMILLQAYLDVHPEFMGQILLQIHDSVVLEISEKMLPFIEDIKADIRKIMEVDVKEFINSVFGVFVDVPLEFKINHCERWS